MTTVATAPDAPPAAPVGTARVTGLLYLGLALTEGGARRVCRGPVSRPAPLIEITIATPRAAAITMNRPALKALRSLVMDGCYL